MDGSAPFHVALTNAVSSSISGAQLSSTSKPLMFVANTSGGTRRRRPARRTRRDPDLGGDRYAGRAVPAHLARLGARRRLTAIPVGRSPGRGTVDGLQ